MPRPADHPATDTVVSLEVHLRTLELKNAERDRAYGDGYDAGLLDGIEIGLRATLNQARAALGAAA
jgi:hypothetical protein